MVPSETLDRVIESKFESFKKFCLTNPKSEKYRQFIMEYGIDRFVRLGIECTKRNPSISYLKFNVPKLKSYDLMVWTIGFINDGLDDIPKCLVCRGPTDHVTEIEGEFRVVPVCHGCAKNSSTVFSGLYPRHVYDPPKMKGKSDEELLEMVKGNFARRFYYDLFWEKYKTMNVEPSIALLDMFDNDKDRFTIAHMRRIGEDVRIWKDVNQDRYWLSPFFHIVSRLLLDKEDVYPPRCAWCGGPTSFSGFRKGFGHTCSVRCSNFYRYHVLGEESGLKKRIAKKPPKRRVRLKEKAPKPRKRKSRRVNIINRVRAEVVIDDFIGSRMKNRAFRRPDAEELGLLKDPKWWEKVILEEGKNLEDLAVEMNLASWVLRKYKLRYAKHVVIPTKRRKK